MSHRLLHATAFVLTLLSTSCQSSRSGPDLAAEAAAPIIQVVRLEHASAQQLAPTLQQLLGGAGSELRVVAVPEQAALALSGRSASVEAAVALIAMLDVPSVSAREDSANIIYLKNASAADIAATLQQFLEHSQHEVEITPHTATNTLLVRASGQDWNRLAALIDHLDKPPTK